MCRGAILLPAPDIYDAPSVVLETYAGMHPCAYIWLCTLEWLPLAIPLYECCFGVVIGMGVR